MNETYNEQERTWYHKCATMTDNSWDVVYGPGDLCREWEPSDGWALQVNEYYPPITYCPYCGEKLETPETPMQAAMKTAAALRVWWEGVKQVLDLGLLAKSGDASARILAAMGHDPSATQYLGEGVVGQTEPPKRAVDGFTLIELLIVLAIVGLLVGVVMIGIRAVGVIP